MQDSVILAYLASIGGANSTTKLARIREGTGYFESKGISSPSQSEYAEWRRYLEATKPGHTKGTLMKPKTSGDWKNDVEGFYEWLNGQRYSKQLFLDMPTEKEDIMLTDKVTDPDVNGALNEAGQVSDAGQVRGEVSAEREAPFPVATDKPRRGRKPKPENADRMQISVYLSAQVYDVIKNYSLLTEQAISDVVASLATKFAVQHKEDVDNEMRFFRESKARMLNIQQ